MIILCMIELAILILFIIGYLCRDKQNYNKYTGYGKYRKTDITDFILPYVAISIMVLIPGLIKIYA